MNVSILVFNDCMAFPSIASMELLRKAGRIYCELNNLEYSKNPFKVNLVSCSKETVIASDNYPVFTHKNHNDITKTDLIIVPALDGDIETLLQINKEAINWLKNIYSPKIDVVSICTGSFILAEAGLLNGKKATTHWIAQDLFKQKYPQIKLLDHSIIVDEKNIITSGGATSFLNMIIYLIEKYCGHETARIASKLFLVDTNKNPQTSYAIFSTQKNHGDNIVLQAQQILESSKNENITINTLAKMVATSRRNLERRFKIATGNTPGHYFQRVRIEEAKKILETTKSNINEVANFIGYEDTPSFRKLFNKITGLSPSQYRTRYSIYHS